MTEADSAGLDEDGIVALFTGELRNFYERRSGSRPHGVSTRDDTEDIA